MQRPKLTRAAAIVAAIALVVAGTGAKSQRSCCAPIVITGSEYTVLPPSPRHFRIWIEPTSTIRGWRSNFPPAVRQAFDAWNAANLPVEFSYTSDSTEANLFVFWRRRFDERVRGRSTWWTEEDVGYVRGEIEIAVSPEDGWFADAPIVRAMTLHEIGHLLGLPHSDDQGSIMSRIVRVTYLPQGDLRRAHELYASFGSPR